MPSETEHELWIRPLPDINDGEVEGSLSITFNTTDLEESQFINIPLALVDDVIHALRDAKRAAQKSRDVVYMVEWD